MLLSLLIACNNTTTAKDAISLGDTATNADSGAGADSAELGDSGGDTGTPPACPVDSDSVTFVTDSIAVGTSSEGFDLDGDGVIDNAAALAKSLLDPQLLDFTANQPEVLILQLWDLQDWCNDAVGVGFINGLDTDGDPSDNHSGSEVFDPGADVDADGHAVYAGAGTIAGSVVTGTIFHAQLNFGFVSIDTATPLYLSGTVAADGFSGIVGTAVDAVALGSFLESQGLPASLATSLADVDTDGDGTADAVSAAFEVHTVTCGIH